MCAAALSSGKMSPADHSDQKISSEILLGILKSSLSTSVPNGSAWTDCADFMENSESVQQAASAPGYTFDASLPAAPSCDKVRTLSLSDLPALLFGEGMAMPAEGAIKINETQGRIDIILYPAEEQRERDEFKVESKGWYSDNFQTIPISNKATYLHVYIHRWRYQDGNKHNDQKSFINTPESVGGRNKRRSHTLETLVWALAVFTSAHAASLICQQLGIKISESTINRMIKAVVIADDPDVDWVGIDDVALRKGMTYCTAIYNGRTHQLLALLPGRRAKELKTWLRSHKKIKLVARDRASAYAKAVSEVLPDCIQVADRFHLLDNLLGRLKDIFTVDLPKCFFFKDGKELDEEPKKVPVPKVPLDTEEFKDLHYDNSTPMDSDGNRIVFDAKRRDPNCAQYLRQAESRRNKYERIQALRKEYFELMEAGIKPKQKDLASKYGISVPTLCRYLAMTDEEVEKVLERKDYKKRSTDVDDYLNMIYKMLRDDYPPEFVYSYILHLGYSGSRKSLKSHIEMIALNNFKITCSRSTFEHEGYPDDITVITRSEILKYMTTTHKENYEGQPVAQYYSQLKKSNGTIGYCEGVWESFHTILMGNDPDLLDSFLLAYENTPIVPFLSGIKMDIAPVKNAISYDVSSGPVEGCNCRFKWVKRTLFGRCSLDLLFHRFYIVSSIFHGGKTVIDFAEN